MKKTISNIKDIFKKNIDTSKNVVKNVQDVTIIESEDFDDSNPRFSKDQQCPASGLRGLLGFTDPKAAYGCQYDIDQEMNLEFSEIKESVIEEYEEINNMIMNDIKAEGTKFKSKGESGEETEDNDKADFIDKLKDETKETVKDILGKTRDNSVSQLQKANVLEIKRPLACSCDNKGPMISQDMQLEIFAKELSEELREKVQEKAIEANIDLELEGIQEDTGKQITCMLQILACTASFLAIGYFVYTIMTNKDLVDADQAEKMSLGKL